MELADYRMTISTELQTEFSPIRRPVDEAVLQRLHHLVSHPGIPRHQHTRLSGAGGRPLEIEGKSV